MKTEIPKGDVGSVFQLWEYRVSHKQLLIRCPKLSEASENVDIKFFNVEYVDLPSTLPDLQMDDATQDDIIFAAGRLGNPIEKKRVVVLKTNGRRYIVIAGAVAISQSKMGIFESPLALPPVDLHSKT